MTDTHDSYLQSDARQEAISAQKGLFLRGLPVDTTVVSDFVLRSWQRSRLAGVDPETTVRKKVDETIFRHILAVEIAGLCAKSFCRQPHFLLAAAKIGDAFPGMLRHQLLRELDASRFSPLLLHKDDLLGGALVGKHKEVFPL